MIWIEIDTLFLVLVIAVLAITIISIKRKMHKVTKRKTIRMHKIRKKPNARRVIRQNENCRLNVDKPIERTAQPVSGNSIHRVKVRDQGERIDNTFMCDVQVTIPSYPTISGYEKQEVSGDSIESYTRETHYPSTSEPCYLTILPTKTNDENDI